MGSQMHIQFISAGFREILMSGGVQSAVSAEAERIKSAANANGSTDGFQAHVWQGNYGGGRWIGSVNTTDYDSMKAEAESKALTRAVR